MQKFSCFKSWFIILKITFESLLFFCSHAPKQNVIITLSVVFTIHIHTNNNGQINCICLFSIKKYNCKSWLLQVIIYTSANCLIFCYLVKYTHLVRQRFELQLTSQSAVLFTSENYLMSSIKIEYVSRKLRFALNSHFNRIYIMLITKIKETLEDDFFLNEIAASVVK